MTPEQRFQRRLSREKRARAQAERLLEKKSRDLYVANQALEESAKNLERQVAERTEELELALEKLHAASRAKDDFLATISHEIRTPLNALLGAVGLLKDSSLDRAQKHYLELGEHAGRVLLEQINHILDFVRLQGIAPEPELEVQTAVNLMDQVVYAVAAKAQAKGLRLFGSVDPQADLELIVDSGKARQVVLNFLDNAIKFTPDGWVWFHVSAKPVDEEYVEILCEVLDTGYGLPSEPNKLFLPFERSDHLQEEARAIEGTGLGLSISKKIVDGFEGKIGAEPSPYGKGSRFWCRSQVLLNQGYESTLPSPGAFEGVYVFVLSHEGPVPWLGRVLELWQINYECVGQLSQSRVDEASAVHPTVYILELGKSKVPQTWQNAVRVTYCAGEREADELDERLNPIVAMTSTELLQGLAEGFRKRNRATTAQSSERNHGRLLLVEDSHANQVITSAMLTRKGYLVDTASNGQEAVDAAARLPYDLILMDIQMPVMDGLEAASLILSSSNPGTVPQIIALTASISDQVQRQCDEIGFCEIVPKPVVPETLFRAVRHWCDESRQAVESEVQDGSEPWVSQSTVIELVRNAPAEVLQRLLTVFVDEAEQRLASCRVSAAEGDLEAVGKQAHALKSAAGTYGASRFHAQALALEQHAQQGDAPEAHRVLEDINCTWEETQRALIEAYNSATAQLES